MKLLKMEPKQLTKEMDKDLEKTCLRRRHASDQYAMKKLLSVMIHSGNANQDDNEIAFHTLWNGNYLKKTTTK